MLLQVIPFSRECKSLKAILVEVMFQVGSANAMVFLRVKNALDGHRIGGSVNLFGLLLAPVLHHHGDAGCAATVFFLFDERNVQPDAGCAGKHNAAETQDTNESLRQISCHENSSSGLPR